MICTFRESMLNLKSMAQNGIAILRGQLRRKQSHAKLIQAFYDHLSNHGENPVTAEDGIAVTGVIDDIRPRLSSAPSPVSL